MKKKNLAMILTTVMVLTLAACGQKAQEGPASQEQSVTTSPAENNTPVEKSDTNNDTEDSTTASTASAQQSESSKIAPAADGTLTISANNIAVVVNGTSVAMPYNLKALEAAGVPAEESRSEIELGSGDFFSLNLYLDENEDYLLIPAYYNGGDSSINITEAEAEEITMTTYADEPEDQNVTILGVAFGMPRNEVKALLGEPVYDDGDYCEWHIEVPDIAYEGTLSMYFTADADEAGVSQVDLIVFEK